MPRIILGSQSIAEIRAALIEAGESSHITEVVRNLAVRYGVSTHRIYALTTDLRPTRKKRSDRGRMKHDLLTHQVLRTIAGWIVEYDISPEEAIRLARQRGLEVPVEFTTLRRYLRAHGLDRKSQKIPAPHRRFESAAPGEIYQFDISGLKTRWIDSSTRKIVEVTKLDVSDNHPNSDPRRIRVWRMALIDDFSRLCFVRYVAAHKPNGSHVTDFLLQAYAELGVPRQLYTDNDGIIKFGRTARTTQLLARLLKSKGGYQHICHRPGNARATGKIERLHQTFERFEKIIGLRIAERGPMSIDDLNNDFAPNLCHFINHRPHSETGQRPIDRWHSERTLIRRLDYDSLRGVFMADEFLLKLYGDLTFRHRGRRLQLPTSDSYPFAAWVGQKIRVVIPDGQMFFTIIGPDGNEYDIPLTHATPDIAGDFKTIPETKPRTLIKKLRAEARESAKQNRISPPPIRHFDPDDDDLKRHIIHFPQPGISLTSTDAVGSAPGRVHEPTLTFWEAVRRFAEEFTSINETKKFLDSIFPNRNADCWLLESEVIAALKSRNDQTRRLKIV